MTAQPPSTDELRDAWDAVAHGFDQHVTPHTLGIGEQVVSRLALGPGDRVLDVGAGSGAVSVPAARAGAEVLAVDIAPTMVERLAARAEAEGLTRLHATVGDATSLDLDDDSHDVAVSLNGASVVPDLTAALAEMVRVTRSGGRVVVGAFGPLPEVEFVGFLLAALRTVVPDRLPPADEPLPPFRLTDPDAMLRALDGVGLVDTSVDVLTWETRFGSVDAFLATIVPSNPIAARLVGGLDEGSRQQLRQVLDGMFRERSGGGPGAVLGSRINLGSGRA